MKKKVKNRSEESMRFETDEWTAMALTAQVAPEQSGNNSKATTVTTAITNPIDIRNPNIVDFEYTFIYFNKNPRTEIDGKRVCIEST